MKLNFFNMVTLLIFLGFFITTSRSSMTTKFAAKEGEADHEKIYSKEYAVKMESVDSFDDVMGMEKCENDEDEDQCLKRRVLEGAHLDYIYTQKRKP